MINNDTLTNSSNTGTFDVLSAKVQALLNEELSFNRITGAEYTQAYVQLMSTVVQVSSQYALSYEISDRQLGLLDEDLNIKKEQTNNLRKDLETKQTQINSMQADIDIKEEQLSQMQSIDEQIKQSQKTSIDNDNSVKQEQLSQLKTIDKEIKETQADVLVEDINIKKEQIKLAQADAELKQEQLDIAKEELKIKQEQHEQFKGIDKEIKEAQKIGINWNNTLTGQKYHTEVRQVMDVNDNHYILDENGFYIGLQASNNPNKSKHGGLTGAAITAQANQAMLTKWQSQVTALKYHIDQMQQQDNYADTLLRDEDGFFEGLEKKDDDDYRGEGGILGRQKKQLDAQILQTKWNNTLIGQKYHTEVRQVMDVNNNHYILDDDGFYIGLQESNNPRESKHGGITGSLIALQAQQTETFKRSDEMKFGKMMSDVNSIVMNKVSGVLPGSYGYDYLSTNNILKNISTNVFGTDHISKTSKTDNDPVGDGT